MKKKILIISFSPLDRDPRVYRQIRFLKNYYHVTTAGFTAAPFDDVEFCHIKSNRRPFYIKKSVSLFLKKVKFFEKAYWLNETVLNAYNLLRQHRFDLIYANDINTLPLAVRLSQANDAKVILDAHEYTPRDFDDKLTFRFIQQDYWDGICRLFLPKLDMMFTVCQGLADEYSRNYNIECNVLTNAPFFENLRPNPVKKNTIKMIHHGSLNTSRRLENMVYLMDRLDERFTLDLMLLKNKIKTYRKLIQLTQNRKRIRFIDPVEMPKISKTINAYDIGLFLLWPESFSYKMALPNKIFEFIQGRLAVAIWPSPEMAKLVNRFELGIISDDFTVDSMAEKLNRLSTKEIFSYKEKSHEAAIHLCAEKNCEKLLDTINSLIG